MILYTLYALHFYIVRVFGGILDYMIGYNLYSLYFYRVRKFVGIRGYLRV